MQCKQCGAQFEGKFCPQCGAPAEEKMSVCPVCGKARSGEDRFCSECGYDFEKKPSAAASAQTSVSAPAAAPQRSAAVARKPFPKKQVLTAVAVVAVIAILLAILIPTISFFTNKFRIGVVEKINLGDSREQVLDLLGEPYDYKEGSSFFEYYSDNYRKLLEQNDSFNPDDIQNWEDFGDAFDEALELEQKLQTEEYQYIAVTFDSDGGVSSVFLDTARCEQNTGKKALKSCSVLTERITAIESEDVYVTEMLPYEAEYTDGSYYMGFTNATSADSGSSAIIRWNDRYGNECSARVEIVLNPSGAGWYFETSEGVLHITSNQESYNFSEEVRESVIEEVVFGADVTFIEGLGISKENLNKVTVSSDNPRFYVAGNCVISSQDGQLVFGCNNSVIPSDGSVTSIGEKAFSNCDGITSVAIPDSVTSIGAKAFYDCDGITSVTIPNSVTSIGAEAFYDCDGITSVTIPNSVTSIGTGAFEDCPIESATMPTLAINFIPQDNLKTVIFTGGTEIENFAFDSCESLTSVTIGESVTSIATSAFSACNSLMSITVSAGNPVYHSDGNCLIETESQTLIAGCKNSIIPDDGSVTSIGSSAFFSCKSLTSITIPDGVTSIGGGAFRSCDSLTSVTIGNGVTSIGDSAFYDCTSLTSITIPDSVTSIGEDAFRDCTSLTSVTIGSGVTSIGSWEFANCENITSIIVSTGNPVYHSVGNCLIETESKTLILGSNTSVIPDDGSVTSIGEYAFVNCNSLTSITIPDSVTSIASSAFSGCDGVREVENGVTYVDRWVIDCDADATTVSLRSDTVGIADSAFRDCDSLSSIIIPDSITSIGSNTFSGCPIESATMPTLAIDSIPKNKLKTVVLTSGASIGNRAFEDCDSLTSITIPDSVTSIGDDAFYDCSNLTDVYIANMAAWCAIDFSSNTATPFYCAENLYLNGELVTDLVIPDSVTSIGDYVFLGCNSLERVTIPNSVTSIGYAAFSSCYSLTSITIPDSVTSIGSKAFYHCDLTSITIPDSVTSIGENAFSGCPIESATIPTSAIDSINIPKTVILTSGTSIEEDAFVNCHSLTSITIPNSITSIGDDAFYGCSNLTDVYIADMAAWCAIDFSSNTATPFYCAENLYLNGELVTDLVIPDSITSIGEYAFFHCNSLTSITIPDSVTSIGDYAFAYCESLASVTIGDSVKSIGEAAFRDCTSLTSATIPNSVKSIGVDAFRDCDSLTSVTIGDGVTSIGSYAFYDCDSLTNATFKNPNGWRAGYTTLSATGLSVPSFAAGYLCRSYYDYTWTRR